jgi:hypothetical protein
MSRILLSIVVAFSFFAIVNSANEVQAQGLHVNTRRLHVDVGQPHSPRYSRASYPYGGYGGYGSHRAYYPQTRIGHGYWHDTTHYDYHPGGFRPHYDHYDYVPGHYDVHHSGHWDGHH